MTADPPAGPRAAEAFSEVLVRLAGERPNLTLLAGEDPGPATWFADVWPERVLTVAAPGTRVGIAQGIRLGGGEAVVVLDAARSRPVLDLAHDVGIVLVSTASAHLGAAFRGGVAVCQPGWPGDLPALVVGALGRPAPTLLHLPDVIGDPADAPPPTTDGSQRVLHRGPAGLLVGAGATADIARRVAVVLSRRHVAVTAVEQHTITPDSQLDAQLLHDHLLVGPLSAPRAAALQAVPAHGSPGEVADRVQAVLQAGA